MDKPQTPLRILMLEDDPATGELMSLWIRDAGYHCHWETRAAGLMRIASRETFDVAILDWHVPDQSGEQVLRWLRTNIQQPMAVIFVTTRQSEADIAHILDQGADDYLVKPARRVELLARLRALARRATESQARDVIELGNIRINQLREEVRLDGELVALSPKEYGIAALMVARAGQLLSREHIYQIVWGRNAPDNLRTVDTHMSQVRHKLRLTIDRGWRMTAIYNRGYRVEFVGDGADEASAPRVTVDVR